MSLLVFFTLLFSYIYGDSVTLQLKWIDKTTYPKALCNDESPSGFYYAPYLSSNKQRLWLVHLMGGQWCWDIESCNQRWEQSPSLMSSNYFSSTISKTGIFDDNINKNPLAYANKIYVPYCSSDAWLGNRKGDNDTNGWSFYGQYIVEAVLKTLVDNYDLGKNSSYQDILIFSGCSAGGRGAMGNLDYIASYVPNSVQILGSFDSPLWIALDPYDPQVVSLTNQTQMAYTFVNATGRASDQCLQKYNQNNEQWKCIFGQYRLPLVQTVHTTNAAQYDAWQLSWNENNSNPATYNTAQNEYAQVFQSQMYNVVLNNIESDIISTECFHHCVTEETYFWNITTSNGESFSSTLRNFLEKNGINNIYEQELMKTHWTNIFINDIDINNSNNNKWMDNCSTGINCGSGCPPLTPFY